ASRAGHLIAVRDKWQTGCDVDTVVEPNSKFMTTVVGWNNDGDEVHEEIVHEGAEAHLSPEGYLEAYNTVDGKQYGARIEISKAHELGIHANFEGRNGHAKFEVWSDPDDPEAAPQVSHISPPVLGRFFNVNLVAWRKVNFKGMFKTPTGEEELEGLGYFQRVLFNGPLGPWIWIWTVFEDHSVFSAFIPYLGLHNARRADGHFSDFMENRLMKIVPTAYFLNEADPDNKETKFTKVDMKIHNANQDLYENLPIVKLRVRNKEGDHLNVTIRAHGHAQFHLDRAVLKQTWMSRWNYNEFMVHVDHIEGSVKGKSIKTNMKVMGEGWGNMEYTWGMSL
ncbi:MAG: hypothetical protein ACXAE3_10960, partial [Candidatus Kariarchaeaceae archaeon]